MLSFNLQTEFSPCIERFCELFGVHNSYLCAWAPGRSELAGNHTDHQGGHALAAALTKYCRGVFVPTTTGRVRLASPGHGTIEFDIASNNIALAEKGKSLALVRGIVHELTLAGARLTGFDALVENDVATGSGLSSSAAFEVCVTQALAHLGDIAISEIETAFISQRAERDWYGKPCGLLDQAASALGSIQLFDFKDQGTLGSRCIDERLEDLGLNLVLVHVGGSHADLTEEYAAIPHEMELVAQAFGKERLCDLTEEAFLSRLPALKDTISDRALCRALHFFREERLTQERVAALEAGDAQAFLKATKRSAQSSATLLQNVFASAVPEQQPANLALALADEILGDTGAARIHGGGFGGTIQAFVTAEMLEDFLAHMDAFLGAGAAQVYEVSEQGASVAWL